MFLYPFVSPSHPQLISAYRHTFTTRGATLAMADDFLPLLPLASTAFLGSTWGFVLLGVAAGVFVNDVGAHVEGFLGGLEAHLWDV